MKKTARRKSKSHNDVKIYLLEDSVIRLRFEFFCDIVSGWFEIDKKTLDFHFHVDTDVSIPGGKKITKDQLRKIVEPFNMLSMRGSRRKKAERMLKAWARIEEFFSI